MSSQSNSADQIIEAPQGGGAIQSIGEKFKPDMFTGTANFTVPISIPAGRNGFQPHLSFDYASGNGNGPFGFGWSLSVPEISRKTSKGIPRYGDTTDVFILSGFEDLVPVASTTTSATYRPRTEGLFARIVHHFDAHNDYWEVRTKDGLISTYGTPGMRSQAGAILDSAIVADPANSQRVFAWKLTLTVDPFGNRIEYAYTRDRGTADGRSWDQVYLSEIRYADYGHPAAPQFLLKVKFTYDGPVWRLGQPPLPPVPRADAFSDYRAGFEIRTAKRCTQIDVLTEPGSEIVARRYHFVYQDQLAKLTPNGASLLNQIAVEGCDGTASEGIPPLEFGYTEFSPSLRSFSVIRGRDLPSQSLSDPNIDLVDLFGNGLPDMLETNGTVRYWRNRGNGTFDLPRPMQYAPAGVGLADPGTQIIDADGDGRPDLMVTTSNISGYYPLTFGGFWDPRSFQRYRVSPTFSLKDPEVRLLDLNGDGVTDAIRSGTSLECYFNDPIDGWNFVNRVPSAELSGFPLDFSDPRVKWADMTGDGMQDAVLVYDGSVEYWPNLGYGRWGDRVSMGDTQGGASPHYPGGYDPKRILLGDVDGDGVADLVYVDDMRVTVWINQAGNRWSDPIVIEGTPPVNDTDSIRLTDLDGNGVAGVLWTSNQASSGRPHMFFLDLIGGVKPNLLSGVNNHMGALTSIEYKPSTWFYLQDQIVPGTRWLTPLPFPVQVVARVETVDVFSGSKLTSEYSYHHGYWDGLEREFRGFGRVDQRDTETFSSTDASTRTFSPPTEVRTWFHQGAIGDRFDGWYESDSPATSPGQKRFTDEYFQELWPGTAPSAHVLSRPAGMTAYLGSMPPAVLRDALRSLRGKILRTELYALDGSDRQSMPYAVSEYIYGAREVAPPAADDPSGPHVFFPFTLSTRSTQWERGGDPLSRFTFTDNCELVGTTLEALDYDDYGQLVSMINVAVPRWRVFQSPGPPGSAYLATESETLHAEPNSQVFIADRVSSTTICEITNDGSLALLDFVKQIQTGVITRNVVSQRINFYDGSAYFNELGAYGALTRTDVLAFTQGMLEILYGGSLPPYLIQSGTPQWTDDYPQEFRDKLPPYAGYTYQAGAPGEPYEAGYYRTTTRRKYDFQAGAPTARGLIFSLKDPLGNETTVSYDAYDLLPISVVNAAQLTTAAEYDYRVLQPNLVTDWNENRIAYGFSPLGLLSQIAVMGKLGENLGDTTHPSSRFILTLMGSDATGVPIPIADLGQPVSKLTIRRTHHDSETDVPEAERDETIESIEFYDGFGRVLQTRTQAEDVLFGSGSQGMPTFGDSGLPIDQSQPVGDAIGTQTTAAPFVVVSGWQIYDNKGQVIEKYEPFFSTGWAFASPTDFEFGQVVSFSYDAVGRVTAITNPDGSEQRVIYGVPGSISNPDLTDPDAFEPTPWEVYAYDEDDNAGRTNPSTSSSFQQCFNTPSSHIFDALGRVVKNVGRNSNLQASGSWVPVNCITTSTYDIVGNVLTVTDPLNRLAFAYSYDLNRAVLRTTTIDAAIHTTVVDAAGNVVERRASKGSLILDSYDELNRPIRKWARDGTAGSITLREKIIYGDSDDSGLSRASAVAANLLGELYLQYDEAGLLTMSSYDFKKNILEKTRNVITEKALLAAFNPPPANWVVTPFHVDWSATDLSFLDKNNAFETTATYDALNRFKGLTCPLNVEGTRTSFTPTYNHAGVLESVQMDATTYVERIAYNARGQRILVSHGNGLMTRYAYDDKTSRLARLRSENYTLAPATTTYHASAPATPLEDFGYARDLVGNILEISDRTPNSGIPNTTLGANALNRDFVYDPFYRLVSATGRECDLPPAPPPWDDSPRCTDLTKVRAYGESYRYDDVGNVALWKHTSFDATGNPSTVARQFILSPNSNRLSSTTSGATTYQYAYGPNGNVVSEGTSRHFEWDQSDRMRVFRIQPAGAPPSVYTQYLYDSSGLRTMKLTRKQNGAYETTIYIDGVFELQRQVGVSGAIIQNNSIHVMDAQKRVAIVRVGPAFPDDGAPGVTVKYQFSDHLNSCNVVVDASGAWVAREEYLPYGETSFGSFARKRYRYTGKERDEESGLYYYGKRYFAPWLARWTACDPIGPEESVNPYTYVQDNPICRTDPTGTQTVNSDTSDDEMPLPDIFLPPQGDASVAPDAVQLGPALERNQQPNLPQTESEPPQSPAARDAGKLDPDPPRQEPAEKSESSRSIELKTPIADLKSNVAGGLVRTSFNVSVLNFEAKVEASGTSTSASALEMTSSDDVGNKCIGLHLETTSLLNEASVDLGYEKSAVHLGGEVAVASSTQVTGVNVLGGFVGISTAERLGVKVGWSFGESKGGGYHAKIDAGPLSIDASVGLAKGPGIGPLEYAAETLQKLGLERAVIQAAWPAPFYGSP